jgi:hypothetical protein
MESGSGPGGRRFKSSLPDQYFQRLGIAAAVSENATVDEIETVRDSEINSDQHLSKTTYLKTKAHPKMRHIMFSAQIDPRLLQSPWSGQLCCL